MAWKSVTYQGATFEAPAGWPVYHLASEPKRCVRFDVHAVYLGHQGVDASCPARLIGRTDAVQVEPLDLQSRAQSLAAGSTVRINGLTAQLAPYAQVERTVVASFPQLMVKVTMTYSGDPALAQRILHSFGAR
jgi:hypothetical protein